ncbi:MAG: hypothetical protein HKP08_08235 [Flavobacteriaceae bacterium]|nr:hypothetical protein [Flavobacteriaceae bacterium]
MIRIIKIPCFIICALVAAQFYAQADTVKLLAPTGPYPVGTMIYEWTDASRFANYTTHPEDKRTLVAQIWYPAKVGDTDMSAPYNAISKDYQKVVGHSFSRPAFHPSVQNTNLILIAPGRGTERFLYTTLSEDLASHGFVVVSVDMPLIGYTIFGDGKIIKPSTAFQPPPGMMGGPYEKVDKFFEAPTTMGVLDLQFVYEQLKDLNKADPNQRFTGKLNLDAIGIFGHSLGGRIAGQYTSDNKYVKAYAAMEGIPPRAVRYKGLINIPTAMLCSKGTFPYAEENYNSFLENAPSPVYLVIMNQFGHNSVTDNPYIYPESFGYDIDPQLALEITRKLITGYFVMQLRGVGELKQDLKDIEQLIITKNTNE